MSATDTSIDRKSTTEHTSDHVQVNCTEVAAEDNLSMGPLVVFMKVNIAHVTARRAEDS